LRERYYYNTGIWRVLPDALIIGAAKSGTTSIYRYLSSHPDVYPARKGNPDYFNIHYDRGLFWYRGFFPLSADKFIRTRLFRKSFIALEDSPFYFVHPLAPERAASTIPEGKLLLLLRNPVDRAYSQFQHEVRAGRETLSFESAINAEEERLGDESERNRKSEQQAYFNLEHYSYKARSRYAEQLRRWFEFFPRENFKIIQSEMFYQQSNEVLQEVLQFFSIRPWPISTSKVHKSGGSYIPMRDSTREVLLEYFEPHNQELFELLGYEFKWR
jgi:hypothetical protein